MVVAAAGYYRSVACDPSVRCLGAAVRMGSGLYRSPRRHLNDSRGSLCRFWSAATVLRDDVLIRQWWINALIFFLTIVPYSLLLEFVRKPNSTIGCASQEYVPRSGRGNGHFCSRALSRSTRRRPSPTLHSSVPCPSTPSCIIDDCSEAVNS